MQLILLALLFSLGCGESASKADDLSAELPMDLSMRVDGAVDDLTPGPDQALANLFCAQSCTQPEACCVVPGAQAMCTTQAACPDGGVFAACTAPSNCGGGTPHCCVTVNLSDPEDAGSSATGAVAQCTATCPGGLSGMSEFRTTLCTRSADCAGYLGNFGFGDEVFDGCCNSARAPNVYFCAPLNYAGPDSYSCL